MELCTTVFKIVKIVLLLLSDTHHGFISRGGEEKGVLGSRLLIGTAQQHPYPEKCVKVTIEYPIIIVITNNNNFNQN